ncbi:hypothetical protein HYS49_03315 [Candidatus Woesearchaeota archaeon]|nr:hypothetical protein [Candidatus Woesearchaeota archaeon]
MLLVVDANIVIAALLSPSGITNNLLFSPRLQFISPEFIEKELDKHFPEIIKKSNASEKELWAASELIFSRIDIPPALEYEAWKEKAEKISPDRNDVEYLAVALAFNCPLWSNDKLLQSQAAVKVLSTSELLKLLS